MTKNEYMGVNQYIIDKWKKLGYTLTLNSPSLIEFSDHKDNGDKKTTIMLYRWKGIFHKEKNMWYYADMTIEETMLVLETFEIVKKWIKEWDKSKNFMRKDWWGA